MLRSYKTVGIVLKRNNVGEVDKIITLFTKGHGKLRLMAKGIRKTKSRKAGSLEPFNEVQLQIAKGRNLDLITETQIIDSPQPWRKNLIKVTVAYYFCELVDKLTAENQIHPDVFELLKTSLGQIGSSNLSKLVRDFEEQLLDELGFGIPEDIRKQPGTLKSYIEEITERRLNSPKLVKN
jgi:DNA repair protein RecO (recombination protein O)